MEEIIIKHLAVMSKMKTGNLEILNDVMIFFNTIWIDDKQKEFFVKFEDFDVCYQVMLNDDNSIDFEEFDEDDILQLIDFHNEDLVEEWNNYYSWRN
jgi:hypothetical protein